MKKTLAGERILSIDVGGSHVKSVILNQEGAMQMDYKKIAFKSLSALVNIRKCLYWGFVKDNSQQPTGLELWKYCCAVLEEECSGCKISRQSCR